jgi:hypothetical protein
LRKEKGKMKREKLEDGALDGASVLPFFPFHFELFTSPISRRHR